MNLKNGLYFILVYNIMLHYIVACHIFTFAIKKTFTVNLFLNAYYDSCCTYTIMKVLLQFFVLWLFIFFFIA